MSPGSVEMVTLSALFSLQSGVHHLKVSTPLVLPHVEALLAPNFRPHHLDVFSVMSITRLFYHCDILTWSPGIVEATMNYFVYVICFP